MTELLETATSAELTEWQAYYRARAEQAKPQPGAHRFNPALTRGA